MRIAQLHSVVPIALAAALLALPAAPRAVRAQVTLAGEPAPAGAVKMAGVYRIVLSAQSMATQRMHLLVRFGETGYTGVLLTGDTEMPLDNLRLEGNVIRATTATSVGRGEILLRITEEGISGTLTAGRTRVAISGDRVE